MAEKTYVISELAAMFRMGGGDVKKYLKQAGVQPVSEATFGARTFRSYGKAALDVLQLRRAEIESRKAARIKPVTTAEPAPAAGPITAPLTDGSALERIERYCVALMGAAANKSQEVVRLSDDDSAALAALLARNQGFGVVAADTRDAVLDLAGRVAILDAKLEAIQETLSQLLDAATKPPVMPDATTLTAVAGAGLDDAPASRYGAN